MKGFISLLLLLVGFGIWNSIGCSSTPTATAPVTVTQYVTATSTPTGSPTPTPTIPVFTYEGSGSGDLQYWYLAYNPGGSVAVTAMGYGSVSGHSLDLTMSSGGNDGQIEVSNAAVGLPTDLTPYNITGVMCYVQFNASCYTGGNGQYNVAVCPYVTTVQAGPVTTKYGGCYNGWVNQNAQFGPNATGGTWFLATLSPTSGTWATNMTNVTALGVDINLSNPVNADIYIDNFRLF